MNPIAIAFDVTDALPVEITGSNRISIAAWLFLPDERFELGDSPVVMSLLHGGSYDKRYFHCEIPDHADYSAARYLAQRGIIVFVPDLLGVGATSKAVDQTMATRQMVALANHAAENQLYQRLQDGSLHHRLPPIADIVKIGVGHSMGGMQVITQQTENSTYDAVMILGFTTIGVHFTVHGQHVRAKEPPPDEFFGEYLQGSREHLHETFHWPDVPDEIVAFDDALAVPTPSTMGLAALRSSLIAADAAHIDVPVFLCMGERDVSPDPHAEVSNYKNSHDVTLFILPKSGHCHNFASTRHLLWQCKHAWAQGIGKKIV